MPRPAPKRTRTAKASKPNDVPEPQAENDANLLPSVEQGSVDPRQALRDQTPLRNNEQAIESSPTGDSQAIGSQPGTASRPPTRSRGYSSTLYLANRQGEGSRIPGTPGFDSSVLSNFRRRPRQQSILHNLQGEEDSSELDDDDFLGGLSPEDESTPLNLPGRNSILQRQSDESPLSSPTKSITPPSTESSRKRKRAEAVQVPASSFELSQDMVQDSPSRTPVARDLESPDRTPIARNSQSHLSNLLVSPQTPQLSELLSQTMALPASSPFSTQTTTTAPGQSPIAATRGKNTKKPSNLSTATLQDQLLPRRRSRRNKRPSGEEFDLISENDDMHNAAPGDEDELNYLPSKRSTKPKPLGNAREKSKLNNKNQKTKVKAKVKAKAKPVIEQQPDPTTYSRRPREDVDKENEMHMSSPSSSPLSTPPGSDVSDAETESTETPGSGSKRRYVSAELRAAARKFAEVDKWQMEFEELNSSEVSAAEI